ncbi:MAG: hypothetical protein ACKOED_02900 [Aestuariivirga sp.]|uniref:hypothetical protein n=1 Tax=Aestuariivirga sp. TaxID=2650926 RepID=UPI0038D06755
MAVALLLPALFVMLPQPALSAAAALDRDLAYGLCGPSGGPNDDSVPRNHAGHGDCILCVTSCPACGPNLAPAEPAFTAWPVHPGIPGPREIAAIALPLRALIDARPPRGPPAFS